MCKAALIAYLKQRGLVKALPLKYKCPDHISGQLTHMIFHAKSKGLEVGIILCDDGRESAKLLPSLVSTSINRQPILTSEKSTTRSSRSRKSYEESSAYCPTSSATYSR